MSDKRDPVLDAIRARLARSVELRSLRQVAREVGISPMGLSKLLRGGYRPVWQTMKKLRFWYLHQGMLDGTEIDLEMARVAMDFFLVGIPLGPIREKAEEKILDFLIEAHHSTGAPPPSWAVHLRSAASEKPESGEK